VEKRGNNIYNSSYLINPQGEIILQYDKCHLFDVDLKRVCVKESAVFTAGNELSVVQTELGTIGILICYDIRFPELARRLTLVGAEMLLVPAAFNTVTGPAHWHITFRARAVENQVFIAAASPARNKSTKYHAYGHSLVVNPWGQVIVEAGKKQEIIYARIKPGILNKTRKRLPLLKQRRPDLYDSLEV
jgi:omega-amidase